MGYNRGMVKRVVTFFDKLEDRIRSGLSRSPIVYALVGAVGIILVWKGVWEMAELIPSLHGFPSVVMGVIILLASGLLVSFFIGDSIIMSGFRHEKKLAEKTEREIESETELIEEIAQKIEHLEEDIHKLGGEKRHII